MQAATEKESRNGRGVAKMIENKSKDSEESLEIRNIIKTEEDR